jgi:DNA-binding Lrp family transcriptional regulator
MTEGFSARRAADPRLDGTDAALLAALQADGRARLEDLARLVGLSTSTVHDRLRRLRRDGVIRRWTVELDPGALGLDVLAFVGVRAARTCAELAGPLCALPEVEEYHSVAGGFGALLKVRVAGPEQLDELLERLRQVPGVEGTETTVVLRTYVERGPRPATEARRKE